MVNSSAATFVGYIDTGGDKTWDEKPSTTVIISITYPAGHIHQLGDMWNSSYLLWCRSVCLPLALVVRPLSTNREAKTTTTTI